MEETLQPGTSVAIVARWHEVNANLVFGWRRLYQQGLLGPDAVVNMPRLLPVQVSAPSARSLNDTSASGAITITLSSGHRIQAPTPVSMQALAPLLELLLRRC